ncbi:thioredoxin-like 1-1, chloroplastic [Oryza brachyantha]|uniref:thioredoxin-like 1-1, chloroplastic n=1 Tax=Oryza brachyantha TaxID=4533 RepID=UPI0003EAD06C|nr:thioredoxin-like 1-1, chloroplastic [Oryza brachyantha]
MAEALCSGSVVASPCGGEVGGRVVRGAAALAESVPIGGYSSRSSFPGGRVALTEKKARLLPRNLEAAPGQMNLTIGKAMRWWERGLQPNMREIESAQDLADSLLNARDKLVVVDFFSPGCGGCRALHPKIAQLAEKNPEVLFLQVNYEKLKSMCYSLHVHVLPFFRFYRGAQGRVSSFSCTNATIKKFKDALAKHGPDRCSLGPAKGLEESELMALAANRDLNFTYSQKQDLVPIADAILKEAAAPGGPWLPLPSSTTHLLTHGSENSLLSSGR